MALIILILLFGLRPLAFMIALSFGLLVVISKKLSDYLKDHQGKGFALETIPTRIFPHK